MVRRGAGVLPPNGGRRRGPYERARIAVASIHVFADGSFQLGYVVPRARGKSLLDSWMSVGSVVV